jgi:hypothetical protein
MARTKSAITFDRLRSPSIAGAVQFTRALQFTRARKRGTVSSKLRRWAAPLSLAATAVLLSAATPAMAGPGVVVDPGPIGPNQAFIGLVNGLSGQSRIAVTCDGPIDVVPTGHPVAGQTFKVSSVVTGSTEIPGFTGSDAKSIFAGLGPSAATTPAALFTFYEVSAPIPTTLVVPCSGTGAVVFTPNRTSATARSAAVKVTFVSKG